MNIRNDNRTNCLNFITTVELLEFEKFCIAFQIRHNI